MSDTHNTSPPGTGPAGVIVFDLDGTLTDTSGDIAFSTNYMRERLGQSPLSVAEVLEAVGRGAPYLLKTLLGVGEGQTEKLNELLKEFERHYLTHQGQHSRLYPGMRAAIESLSSRYDLYVLSNKPERATVREVEKAGIRKFFRAVWGAGSLPGLKPDPIGVLRALKTSDIPRSLGVMVGDLFVDIQTAHNAGVMSCFVTWGFGKTPGGLFPTVTVDAADELVPKIDGMLQP